MNASPLTCQESLECRNWERKSEFQMSAAEAELMVRGTRQHADGVCGRALAGDIVLPRCNSCVTGSSRAPVQLLATKCASVQDAIGDVDRWPDK